MKSLLPSRRKPSPEKQSSTATHSHVNHPANLFGHLPVELLLVIFRHLTIPADVISALNVCRTWRSILLSPGIWPVLSACFAPGLAAHIHACSSSTNAQGEAFQAALLQHHLRGSGLFNHATHHLVSLDLNDDTFKLSKQLPIASGGVHSINQVEGLDPNAEDEHVSRVKLYSHGRVAWWPEGWHLPFFAIVDDLRARSRRMYLFPGQVDRGEEGQRGWKTAMGECLFVMGQEDAGVCVWHLERDEMREVVLPGAFDRCVVQGERLLFVGRRSAMVWLWTWETGTTKTVNVSALGCYDPGPVVMGGQIVLGYPPNPRPAPKVGLRFRDTDVKLDFILHPINPEVFFVVTWDEIDLVVYEITSRKVTSRDVLPRESLAHTILQRSRTVNTVHYLRYERSDAYGGYCLMTASIGSEPICRGSCTYPGGIGSVCFNVYTKTFTALVHHAVYQRTPDTHLWGGLLAVGVSGEDPIANMTASERIRNLQPVVVLLEPCDGDKYSGEPIEAGCQLPIRTKPRPPAAARASKGELCFVPFDDDAIRPRPQQLLRVVYALEAGGGTKETGLDVLKAEWLNGDEKMLIYVAGKEYTVWTFGDDSGPKEKKEGRAWRDRWRSVMAGAGRSAK